MLEILANFAWHEACWEAKRTGIFTGNRRIHHAVSKLGGWTWFGYQVG